MKTIIPDWLEKRITYLKNEKRRAKSQLEKRKSEQNKAKLEAIT
jgi:uncharacterized small protein (DUF1192 family)